MKWVWRDGDKVISYLIEHDGEGPRGASVEFVGVPNSGSHVAEHAAEYFQDLEKQRRGLADSDLDGTSLVIEVCGIYDVPVRYRVGCKVGRHYQCSEMIS